MIRELESVQRSFTKRIDGMQDLDYHTRLQRLKLYSLERRRDRYIIIYVWRVINGFSPNLDSSQIRTQNDDGRRGLECVVPPLIAASGRLQTICECSLAVNGPRLFNCIPKDLREFRGSPDAFKGRLDKFLQGIPDKPVLVGQPQSVNCNSVNSRVNELRQENPLIR